MCNGQKAIQRKIIWKCGKKFVKVGKGLSEVSNGLIYEECLISTYGDSLIIGMVGNK